MGTALVLVTRSPLFAVQAAAKAVGDEALCQKPSLDVLTCSFQ